VLSGDLHGFYASELHADFDAPTEPIAVEYATSAISAATVDVQLDAVIAGNLVLKGLGLAELVPELDNNSRPSRSIRHSAASAWCRARRHRAEE